MRSHLSARISFSQTPSSAQLPPRLLSLALRQRLPIKRERIRTSEGRSLLHERWKLILPSLVSPLSSSTRPIRSPHSSPILRFLAQRALATSSRPPAPLPKPVETSSRPSPTPRRLRRRLRLPAPRLRIFPTLFYRIPSFLRPNPLRFLAIIQRARLLRDRIKIHLSLLQNQDMVNASDVQYVNLRNHAISEGDQMVRENVILRERQEGTQPCHHRPDASPTRERHTPRAIRPALALCPPKAKIINA